MSFDLDQIKLNQFSDKLQVTFFDMEGRVLESCDSVLPIDRSQSIFDQFLFLKSLEEAFTAMLDGEEQRFSEVEWNEGKQGLFHLVFRKIINEGAPAIQWTIIDNTFYYDKLLNLQQSRNDRAISEEFAQIKKRVIEAEKNLLEFKNEELERIQQFKTDFFAQVSHEMRTPLNSITGLVGLLEKGATPSYLEALKSTSKHLNSIINDILDLSKIESGKLEFESINFDLTRSLRSSMEGFLFAAEQKGTDLKISLPEGPLMVQSDPTRLNQILYNLVGNSIKFTEEGHVHLSVKTQVDDNLMIIEFRVEDSGIGMDEETLNKILKPYEQASSEVSRLYGGTGLGLSISKQLIEAFGGELKIESEKGKGTTMSFSVSVPKGQIEPDEGTEEEHNLSGLRILLAEDDPVSQSILKQQLSSAGAQVDVVDDGAELQARLASVTYDLVISDIHLPEKSGVEVLRDQRSQGKATPFLFVSGDQVDSVGLTKADAPWRFLMKPVEQTDLLSSVFGLSSSRSETISVDLTKVRSLIDDPEFVNDLLQTVLSTLPKELANLAGSIKDSDLAGARKVLHKIKPSINYLGVPSLNDQRTSLHDQTAEEVSHDSFQSEAEQFIAKVKLALESLRSELEA